MSEPGKFEGELDSARKTEHSLWAGFLNADPDDSSCPQSPSEVYNEAFEAGARWAISESSVVRELARALENMRTENDCHAEMLAEKGVHIAGSWTGLAESALAEYAKAKGGGK